MEPIVERLEHRIKMQEKIDKDIKTERYFAGAGLTIEVYRGGKTAYEPDYYVEISSQEECEEFMRLLSKMNKNSIEFCEKMMKSKKRDLEKALMKYEEYKGKSNADN